MSFRSRLMLVAAAAVAIVVVGASATVYFVAKGQLRKPVEDGLQRRVADIVRHPIQTGQDGGGDVFLILPRQDFGEAASYVQLVKSDGTTIRESRDSVVLPVNDHVRSVARGEKPAFAADERVAGTHVRVLTFPYVKGYAVQVARSLGEVDSALARIRTFLLLIAGLGIAAAAAAGLAVARTALTPVRRLTKAAEHVAETRDLSERIEATGRDELSRLASSFNTMLAALEESTRQQRQLVADASHELRTPITSLRTNIEILTTERELPPGERKQLLGDVVEQLGEMTKLIAELIDLAREEQQPDDLQDVRLDLVTADAIERTRRNRPGVTFETDLDESMVRGVPFKIERAVGNLLDNAAKWSPPGEPVEVSVRAGEISIRDHGQGIDEADLPFIFHRFYRSPSARGMPGSGLGLSIVRQVAEAHGGEVVVDLPADGGTRMVLRLNGARGTSEGREDALPASSRSG